jgi:phosphate transport system substrate-binding protein
LQTITESDPSRGSQGRRHALGLVKAAAVLAAAGLITAACGSSTPSATKKSSDNHHASASASTTTTTTTAASSTTSTTVAAASTKAVTTPTAAPSAKATTTTTAAKTPVATTPGGSLSADPTSSPAAALTGIGSSSIVPFYGKALYEYHAANSGVTVNYSGSGSGPGVTAVEQNTASFGQSEVPMTAAQLAASKGAVLQVPVDLGGISISYNEPCAGAGLHLTGPQIAQIYLRQITNWSQLSASCPASDNIIPVFRTDTSGPGYDLDQYLIDTSPAWTSAIGTTSPSTTWPTAGRATGNTGENLNAGVATYVQETHGAIGYVEYSYALQANFTNAALQNQAGAFVTPSAATIGAAGAQAGGLSPTNFNIINGAGSGTYPLANFSWALIYQKQANTNTGIVLGKLFQWITTTAQGYSSGLGYAPLPANAVSLAHQTLLGLQTSSGSPIFTS